MSQNHTYPTRMYEGVPYQRYVVQFRLASGERQRWIRYAPAYVYMRGAIVRELSERDLDVLPGSCRIISAAV